MCDKVARAIRDRDEEKSYETERRQRTVLRGRGRNERLTKFALCRERERVSHFQKSDTECVPCPSATRLIGNEGRDKADAKDEGGRDNNSGSSC